MRKSLLLLIVAGMFACHGRTPVAAVKLQADTATGAIDSSAAADGEDEERPFRPTYEFDESREMVSNLRSGYMDSFSAGGHYQFV